MTITEILIASVPVADQERAKAFYVDTLGLELLRDAPMGPGQRWVQVGPKGGGASLTLVTWFDSMPAGSLSGLVLNSDDIDADCERLRGQGVPVDGPDDAPWGRQAVVRDPDGNGLVLMRPNRSM